MARRRGRDQERGDHLGQSLVREYGRHRLLFRAGRALEAVVRQLVRLQGRQLIAYLFGFRAPVSDFACQKFGVGTGLTVARTTDVALEAPILLSGQPTKNIDFVDYVNPYVARVIYTLGTADANGYMISETGLFSGSNAMMARKVQAVTINKTSDFGPTLTWRIRF